MFYPFIIMIKVHFITPRKSICSYKLFPLVCSHIHLNMPNFSSWKLSHVGPGQYLNERNYFLYNGVGILLPCLQCYLLFEGQLAIKNFQALKFQFVCRLTTEISYTQHGFSITLFHEKLSTSSCNYSLWFYLFLRMVFGI